MDKRSSARKKPVNLTIDAGLAAEAKAAGLNLSAMLEAALIGSLQERRLALWRDENRDAIAAYNAFVEANGLISDDWRSF